MHHVHEYAHGRGKENRKSRPGGQDVTPHRGAGHRIASQSTSHRIAAYST